MKQTLLAGGLDADTAAAMLDTAVAQAKADGTYQSAYSSAYQSAYTSAYNEAYNEAWAKIADEIDEKYADAEEKYDLNDPDFQAVPVTLYENFYRNEDEDHDNDGTSDGTIRVYTQTNDVNLACLIDGAFPVRDDEIAIDRMHADNVGLRTGDTITVGGKTYRISGLIAYVNYATLHEKATDLMFDALKFDVAMVAPGGFARLQKPVHYVYAWQYADVPADETAEKALSDDFLRALLTQTVVAENDLEDYTPRYANPAINFAPDDMGSDEAMGGVLLDILIVIIAFIFAVTINNTITKEASAIGTLRASGYTRGELVRHYLAMPVIVTLAAACVGNVLGYTVFKNVVVSMYYNSYSLPTYKTVWNPDAFLRTTLIPVVLMFVVNFLIITRMMRHTPLQFLRHDLKKARRKGAPPAKLELLRPLPAAHHLPEHRKLPHFVRRRVLHHGHAGHGHRYAQHAQVLPEPDGRHDVHKLPVRAQILRGRKWRRRYDAKPGRGSLLHDLSRAQERRARRGSQRLRHRGRQPLRADR